MSRSRRARLRLALCASVAFLFAALAWQRAAGGSPEWTVAAFSAAAFLSLCLAPVGAAVGILASPGAHHGPRAGAGLAARDEYVIPPAPAHSPAWQTRPWRPHNPAEARIGQTGNGHSEAPRRQP